MPANYTAEYSAAETSEVAIDLIVGVGAVFFSFVSIIGLLILWKFLRGKKVM